MKKDNAQKIAVERIKKLFELAKKEKNGRAKRYVELARRIAEKTRTRLPHDIKRSFCRKCNSLFNAKNRRVRISKKEKKVVYTCLCCGHIQRYPFVREKLRST